MYERKIDIERIKKLAIERAKIECAKKYSTYICKDFQVLDETVLDNFVMCKVQFKRGFKRNFDIETFNIKIEI